MLRIKSRDIEEFKFNEKVDVYGLGLILWEIFHPGQNIWEVNYDNNDIAKFRINTLIDIASQSPLNS